MDIQNSRNQHDTFDQTSTSRSPDHGGIAKQEQTAKTTGPAPRWHNANASSGINGGKTRRRYPASTSRAAWAMFVLSAVALMIVRVPEAIQRATQSIKNDHEISAESSELTELAIGIGVGGSVLLYCIATLIYCAVGAFLESRLFPATHRAGKIRVGVAWMTLVAIVIPIAIAAVVLEPVQAAVPLRYVYIAAVSFGVPLLFSPARSSVRQYGRALLVTVPIGAILCIH